jgi:chemotaxis protein CheX
VTDIIKKHEHLLTVIQNITSQVFSTMLDLTVVPDAVSVHTEPLIPSNGLVALVGMAGAVSGSGCLCLSRTLACQAASRFLMAEYAEVNDEVLDAVAELSNMIIGGLKTSLEEELGPMGLSLPTIIFGDNYVTRSPSLGERIVVSFRCEDGEVSEQFSIVVCLISQNQSRSYLSELATFHARLS